MAASLRATGFDPDVDVAVAPASNRPSAKRKRDSSAHFSGDVHNSLSTVMAFNTFVDYLTAVPNDSSDSSNSEKRWSQQRLYLAQCPIWMPPNGGGSENQAPLKHIFEQVSPAPPVLPLDQLEAVNLWASCGDTDSSLHYDMMHNLLCVVRGSKTVRLFPPSDAHCLYPNPLWHTSPHHSPIMPTSEAGGSRYPDFAHCANPIIAEVGEGDTLFIPAGWWHQVSSSCPENDPCGCNATLAVNWWWSESPPAVPTPTSMPAAAAAAASSSSALKHYTLDPSHPSFFYHVRCMLAEVSAAQLSAFTERECTTASLVGLGHVKDVAAHSADAGHSTHLLSVVLSSNWGACCLAVMKACGSDVQAALLAGSCDFPTELADRLLTAPPFFIHTLMTKLEEHDQASEACSDAFYHSFFAVFGHCKAREQLQVSDADGARTAAVAYFLQQKERWAKTCTQKVLRGIIGQD